MPTPKSHSSKKPRRRLQGCNKEIKSKRRSVSGNRRNAYGSFPENKCGTPVCSRVSLQGERGGLPQRRNRSQNQQRPPAGIITQQMIADIYLCTLDAQLTCYLKGVLDLCLNPATRGHRENLQRHWLSDYSSLHAGLFLFCSNSPGTLGRIVNRRSLFYFLLVSRRVVSGRRSSSGDRPSLPRL
jgi:hypothetical protein